MRKTVFLILTLFVCTISGFAQQIDKQGTYEFKNLKKDSYLGNVEYDPASKTTTLHYVEKNSFNTIFTSYTFDEDLNFVEETFDKYTLGEQVKDDIAAIKEQFSWFNYKGEEIEKEIVSVDQSWGGNLVIRKMKWIRTYNWTFGFYNDRFENLETMKIQGLDGDRVYLYDRFNNTETGEVTILVGVKPPKGETKGKKFQHARKFQLIKITPDFNAEYKDTWEFEHNMAVSFSKSLSPFEEEEGTGIADLAQGDVAIIFSPVKAFLGKKWQSDNPEKQTMVIINAEGAVASRIDYEAPTSGWVVEDVAFSDDGKDVYFYGPAKDKEYVNKLMPTNSPLTGRDELKDIKYKNFQIIKISNNKMAWINNTDLKEFKTKAVTPPSQKKSPDYEGKDFVKNIVYVTSSGELIVAGQKYNTKKVPSDPNDPESPKMKVIDAYKDLVMFHFDAKGNLKSQYGIRRDKNNKYSKGTLTPQYLYENEDGSKLYWVYGEIQGMRKGFKLGGGILELAGQGTLSKRKLLFYPTVAEVDLGTGKMGDFVPLGADEGGKQVYFTNPEFPQLMTSDYSNLIFVGENKKGSEIWLAKMPIE